MNTLSVPMIRATAIDGTAVTLTLPGVLAWLARDAVAGFPALRAHQRHAWHSFLVLLAANALHRASLAEPPDSEDAWCDLLRRLTPDDADDAWCLVSPPDRPALLQPPILSGRLADLTKEIATPDCLDMLVTAKNHDLKQAVMATSQADDWLFALLTLQTMEGFLGAGNYGISRHGRRLRHRALGMPRKAGPVQGSGATCRLSRALACAAGSAPPATRPRVGRRCGWRRRTARSRCGGVCWDGMRTSRIVPAGPADVA